MTSSMLGAWGKPMSIYVFVPGEPYCQNKTRGKTRGCKEWTDAVVEATKSLPKTTRACRADITFVLPENKYPKDHPYGSDLDNLLKRLSDALNMTVFADAPGKDGSIVKVTASKRRVSEAEPPGAHVKISEEGEYASALRTGATSGSPSS